MLVPLAVVVVVAAAAFWWAPFLGAVLLVGAVAGLLWLVGPAVLDRITGWLGSGR